LQGQIARSGLFRFGRRSDAQANASKALATLLTCGIDKRLPGRFDIMRHLKALSDVITLPHTGNIRGSDHGILPSGIQTWADA